MMEEWNGIEWVIIDEDDNSEDNPQDLDDVVDKMMTDPDYYDNVVGWF